ncbi:MAG: hypothetical protein L6R42_004167 [Xanthoria sp. 1 TBL-2021]|nr:MAG: hypothetical protein L6R42_004167 [Xanthoria sp. 1 TBL-2021]
MRLPAQDHRQQSGKKEQSMSGMMSAPPQQPSDIIKIIFAIFLPPVGVALEKGIGSDFCINVLLTILGYIPGIIHALYVILTVCYQQRAVGETRKS